MKTKTVTSNLETNAVSDVTPKKKKKLNKKQKIIISVISIILVIALLFGGWYLYELNINKWELKQQEITIEYGETYEPELTELIDTEKYSNITADNTAINANFQNEDNKDYLSVGSYDISITHKAEYKLFGAVLFSSEDNKTVKLNVVDTVAPVFNEDVPAEIEVYKDCSIENIEETFKATDLSDVEITVDNENVDYSTVGEYTTNVYATDGSGNVTAKEVKIIVKEPTINVDPTNITLTVGETASISATVKGKDQTVEWTSSDESVATVDNNGKITAVKKGTSTITAKANDVQTTVAIIVTSKTTSSSNNSNSNTQTSSGSSSNKKNPSTSSSSSKPSGSSSSSNNNTSSGSSSSGTHQHSMPVGNMGRWFESKNELITYYNSVAEEWNNKLDKGQISIEEYYNNVPRGYECWSCSGCGKWSGNFKYR